MEVRLTNPRSAEGLRVAISQPAMHRVVADHVAEIERALAASAKSGADLVLFPELTLTGLHRDVPELLDRPVLEQAMRTVREMCRQHAIAAAVGAPVWTHSGKPLDAMVVLDATGDQILVAPKLRLMPPGEPLLFDPGTQRQLLSFKGSSIGVVICREIFDRDGVARELGGRTRIIFWPGSIIRVPMDPSNPEDVTHLALRLASDQDAWLYHSNWAFNVEVPSLPNTGRSFLVSPAGQITIEAPPQVPGLLLAWETSLDTAWMPAAVL
jgi:predicted amidohydrolase